MDMHHGRIIPALAAVATGAALGAAFVATCGLDADLAMSSGALAMMIAAFIGPGVAGALAAAWLSRLAPPRGARVYRKASTVAPAIAPFAAAEAVADIRSLTEERVLRHARNRRPAKDDRRAPALAS